jgi:hypothetical protein
MTPIILSRSLSSRPSGRLVARARIPRVPCVSSPRPVIGFARKRDPDRGFHAMVTIVSNVENADEMEDK